MGEVIKNRRFYIEKGSITKNEHPENIKHKSSAYYKYFDEDGNPIKDDKENEAEPQVLTEPDSISAETLASMDETVNNFKLGKTSDPVDLSDTN